MKPKPLSQGLLITFEGGEGSGKTTLLQRIHRELISRGYSVVITREPGGTALGDHIRQWLLSKDESISISPPAELLLFLAGRAQNLEEVIKPALKQGKVVLCDRFNESTIAYQGIARGLGAHYVQQLCEIVCQGLSPNLTFFLDVDPEIGLRRTRKLAKDHAAEGAMDRIESESLAFHKLVQEGFREQAKRHSERIISLDAAQSEAIVFTQAMTCLEALFMKN